MPTSPFVHLHLHTEYSAFNSICKVVDVIETVKAMGMTAVAITDSNTLSGVPAFYAAAQKAGIKPIIGCEFNITTKSAIIPDSGGVITP